MTDRDDEAPVETNPDGSPKRDLRYSEHEERNVRISRDLDGSGHLARGDRTHMSVLNFSSRHQSRTERDPEFEHRPPPARKTEAAAPPPAPEPPVAPAPASAAGKSPSLVTRLKNIFGL